MRILNSLFTFLPFFIVGNVFWEGYNVSVKSSIKTKIEGGLFTQEKSHQINKINLNDVKMSLSQSNPWFLLIVHKTCPDSVAFLEFLKQYSYQENQKLKINTIDTIDYTSQTKEDEWNNLIGKKSIVSENIIYKSPKIKEFSFKYTPTLLIIKENKAVSVFDGFGGGEKYKTRYLRDKDDEISKAKAYKNLKYDLDELIIKNK